MAAHMQDQILDAIKTVLIAANTAAGARVRVEGVDPVAADDCPAIDIEAAGETVESVGLSRRTQRRDFDVEIRLSVTQKSDYRSKAGELLAQIESALRPASGAPTFVDVLVPDGIRMSASQPDRDGGGARPVYAIRTMWRCRYFVKEGAPFAPTSQP